MRKTIWHQFVEQKHRFIGGTVKDVSANMETKIKDLELQSDGNKSFLFCIVGEKFTCSFNIQDGGIGRQLGAPGTITFYNPWIGDFLITPEVIDPDWVNQMCNALEKRYES